VAPVSSGLQANTDKDGAEERFLCRHNVRVRGGVGIKLESMDGEELALHLTEARRLIARTKPQLATDLSSRTRQRSRDIAKYRLGRDNHCLCVFGRRKWSGETQKH
jgi:hypothetical protein